MPKNFTLLHFMEELGLLVRDAIPETVEKPKPSAQTSNSNSNSNNNGTLVPIDAPVQRLSRVLVKALGQGGVHLRGRGRAVEALERFDAALAHAALAHGALAHSAPQEVPAERGWTLAQIGFCYADLGLPAHAATVLAQAVALLPPGFDLAITKVHRIVQAIDAGRTKSEEAEAELALLEPILGDPQNPRRLAQLRFAQGWAKQSADQFEQAIGLLQDAARMAPTGGAEVCQWALLRVCLKSNATLTDEALRSLGSAYKTVLARVQSRSLDPREPCCGELAPALFLLAELFARQGLHTDALLLVTRALELKESVWTALSALLPTLKYLKPESSGPLEPWWLRGAQELQARTQARANALGQSHVPAAWAALRQDLELPN